MSKMSLGRTKVGYTVNYGIAPYVKKLLHEQLDKCRWITVSYDESLNHAAQKGHMDFHLRFWDDEKQQVSTRYYDSHFLGHAKVKDLKDSFESCLEKVAEEKMLQVSMDGPNVNLRLLNELKSDRAELIDIGSCYIHLLELFELCPSLE